MNRRDFLISSLTVPLIGAKTSQAGYGPLPNVLTQADGYKVAHALRFPPPLTDHLRAIQSIVQDNMMQIRPAVVPASDIEMALAAHGKSLRYPANVTVRIPKYDNM